MVSGKLMVDEGIDDHHIFPSKYLERIGINSIRLRDCVLNRTLIDRTTNQIISDRAPSDYLNEISSTSGFPIDKVLESHTLPIEKDSPLFKNDYEAFLNWRQIQIWNEIQYMTGLGVPSVSTDDIA